MIEPRSQHVFCQADFSHMNTPLIFCFLNFIIIIFFSIYFSIVSTHSWRGKASGPLFIMGTLQRWESYFCFERKWGREGSGWFLFFVFIYIIHRTISLQILHTLIGWKICTNISRKSLNMPLTLGVQDHKNIKFLMATAVKGLRAWNSKYQ